MSERNSTLPLNPLGELIICPVCYEEYEGHILLCIAGHAVCQKCKIQLTECPQCKSPYTGTRNYSMEDVVQKVQSIRAQSSVTSNEIKRIADLKKPKEAQDAELAEAASRKAAAQALLDNAPRPNKRNRKKYPIEDDKIPNFFRSFEPTIHENKLCFGDSIISNRPSIADNAVIYRKPIQIKGSHLRCEFSGCSAVLPICRLYNHLRYHHIKQYSELKPAVLGEYNTHVELMLTIVVKEPVKYTHGIKIFDFGLFFLRIHVKHADKTGTRVITGWLQGTVKNRDARIFKYELEVCTYTEKFKFTDLCFGVNQSVQGLDKHGKGYLNVETKCKFEDLKVNLKVYRWFGSPGVNRTKNYMKLPYQRPVVLPSVPVASVA